MNSVLMKLGFVLTAIGVSCADSECLIVPSVMTITGALLMYFGSKENIEN